MIIDEPVYCDEVDWDDKSLWCKSQAIWKGKKICSAHIDSGRVFTCDYKSPNEPNLKKCMDFEQKEKEDADKD